MTNSAPKDRFNGRQGFGAPQGFRQRVAQQNGLDSIKKQRIKTIM